MPGLIRSIIAPVLALLLLATPGLAQHWATRAACEISAPAIRPTALSQPDLAALRHQAADVPNGIGNFWRITAPSGAVSHLWGTMHSSDRFVLALPEELENAIAAARLLAVEIDYTFADRAALRRNMADPGAFRDTNGRDTAPPYAAFEIPPRIHSAISLRLKETGYGADAVAYLTPAGLLDAIWGDPCEDFNAGILPLQDDRIQTLAHIAGAAIKGLEPASAFHDRINAPQARDLARALLLLSGYYLEDTDPAQLNADRATTVALYLAGENAVLDLWDRADTLARFGPDEGARIHDTANAYLLTERNLDFHAAIRDDLAQGGVVMAIGSAHLAGEGGMVALLRRNGYRVSRVILERERTE